MIAKYLRAAYEGIVRGGRRTFLALLGIAMSIYLVLSLVAIGSGVQTQIKEQVTAIGSDVVGVSSTSPTEENDINTGQLLNGLSLPTLTLDDVAVITRQPTVTSAAPIRYLSGDIRYGSRSTSPTFLAATTSEYPSARGEVELAEGRFFEAEEQDNDIPKVVIGPATKDALFGERGAVGKKISFDERDLEVVGVLEPINSVSVGATANNLDNVLYGPPNLVGDVEQRNLYSLVLAKVSPTSAVDETAATIKSELSKQRASDTFIVATESDRLNTSQTILSVLAAFIVIIGLITVVISGIGVMNVMVLSVTERTKEIGIRKTVGATAKHIFNQFLIEAVILSALGGALGIVLAVATVYAVRQFAPISPELTPQLAGMGLLLSLVTGVVFGISPALSAARREPIEALQTDRS
ncbi:ABC transporter permease [Candidatus Saccharibacteria bacterium]|nr:ABC transporter permease [Candidatus Saccharibacteria bacterium]